MRGDPTDEVGAVRHELSGVVGAIASFTTLVNQGLESLADQHRIAADDPLLGQLIDDTRALDQAAQRAAELVDLLADESS